MKPLNILTRGVVLITVIYLIWHAVAIFSYAARVMDCDGSYITNTCYEEIN